MYVEYCSNNSGGHWWLKDEDWQRLEQEGWEVKWIKDDPYYQKMSLKDGRWLGCLAKSAIKRDAKSLKMAISEWEYITGKDAYDPGCSCCGQPHEFYSYNDDGSYIPSYLY